MNYLNRKCIYCNKKKIIQEIENVDTYIYRCQYCLMKYTKNFIENADMKKWHLIRIFKIYKIGYIYDNHYNKYIPMLILYGIYIKNRYIVAYKWLHELYYYFHKKYYKNKG